MKLLLALVLVDHSEHVILYRSSVQCIPANCYLFLYTGMINMLVFSQQTDLQAISLDVRYFSKVPIKVLTDMQNIMASDVDPTTGNIHFITGSL